MLRVGSLFVLAVALLLPASGTAESSGVTVTRAVSLEGLVLDEINSVRHARGLSRLAPSNALTKAALTHSRAMVVRGFFTHQSRDGTPFWKRVKHFYAATRGRGGAWTVGENLAMFGGSPPDAEAIVAAWMASPPHRANLLRRMFDDAGVAIVHDPAAGGVFGGQPTWVITLDVGRR